MKTLAALLCLSFTILPAAALAADEVLLQPGLPGHVSIRFPNGAVAELLPMIEGLRWPRSDARDAELVEDAGLFADGQTFNIPVRGSAPGQLEVFTQLEVNPDTPELLRFTCRFTARETTRLNCAKLVLNMPVEPYIGQPVEALDGKQTVPAFTEEPLRGGHLVIGTASGIAVAEGEPHGFRIKLDERRWCLVDDERRWTYENRFSVQLCGIIASKGTTMQAGQSVTVAGEILFAEPIRVVKSEAGAGAALVPRGFRADLEDPLLPRLCDDDGHQVAQIGLNQRGWMFAILQPQPDPEAEALVVEEGRVGVRGRLPGKRHVPTDREGHFLTEDAHGFDVIQTVSHKVGKMVIAARLFAPEEFAHNGLAWVADLSGRQFEGAMVHFLGSLAAPVELTPALEPQPPPAGPGFMRDLPGMQRRGQMGARLAEAIARGVRIETAEGPILELHSEELRSWGIRRFGESDFVIHQWLMEDRGIAAESSYAYELTCRWGGE